MLCNSDSAKANRRIAYFIANTSGAATVTTTLWDTHLRGSEVPRMGLAVEMTGDAMAVGRRPQRRRLLGAAREGVRAAIAEAAAGWRLPGVGDVAGDRQWCAGLVGVGHGHGGDQRAGVGMARAADDLGRRSVFDHHAEIHYHRALA